LKQPLSTTHLRSTHSVPGNILLATSNMTLFVVAFFPCNTPLLANHCRFENTKSVYVSHAFRIGTTYHGSRTCR
jgi:putative component of membrane protein insertase Oxa1/YidC/SpoIIIJ protein YidD